MRPEQSNIESIEVRSHNQPTRKGKFSVTRFRVLKMESKRRQKKHSCPNLERSHTVFRYLMALLIGLLQVDYQSKTVSPFDTHPVNMWVCFGATFAYFLGQSIEKQVQKHRSTRRYSHLIGDFILSSGVLSSVSMASVFLPRLLGWLCMGLSTVLPIILARQFFKQIYEWLKPAIMRKMSQVGGIFKRLWGYITWKNKYLPH
ncbi:hypothetical protein ACOSP7_014812 [Xanthoceras sorbifolium]